MTINLIRAIAICIVSGVAILAPSDANAGCASSWSTKEYKSFGQVRAEILGKYAGARITSIQLCGEGLTAYLRVTIDTGREIKTITLGAK